MWCPFFLLKLSLSPDLTQLAILSPLAGIAAQYNLSPPFLVSQWIPQLAQLYSCKVGKLSGRKSYGLFFLGLLDILVQIWYIQHISLLTFLLIYCKFEMSVSTSGHPSIKFAEIIVLLLSIYACITLFAFVPDRFKFLLDRFAVNTALVLHKPDIQPQIQYKRALACGCLFIS